MTERHKELVIIDDMADSNGVVERLKDFGIRVVCSVWASCRLLEWHGWRELNPANSIVVFPGRGAVDVYASIKDGLAAAWLHQIRLISHKRLCPPGMSPVAIAERIYQNRMVLGCQNVIIVDDVISSGATCRRVRADNMPWIPGASWHALCWVRQAVTNLKGFESVFAANEVGNSQLAAINSLSTLVNDRVVAAKFANRNLGSRADEFLTLLS